ncbi:STAS domain-containing protein [Streptomyces sp. NPDC001046]|uniref:STAS domain-containing protein n=1 Tax=Streptomyces sp. NPDC001046 TaxID=3364543 RepID=UPI0036ACA4D0
MSPSQPADQPRRLSVEHRMVDGVRVVALRGEIDHDVQEQFSQALLGEGDAGSVRVVADFRGVTFMDSSGINVLVATRRQVSQAGGWLRIAGAQESVLRVLQMTGVDSLIDCLPTIEQALTA